MLIDKLDKVRWRRVASGLHQALGLVVVGGKAFVLGRDQIAALGFSLGQREVPLIAPLRVVRPLQLGKGGTRCPPL